MVPLCSEGGWRRACQAASSRTFPSPCCRCIPEDSSAHGQDNKLPKKQKKHLINTKQSYKCLNPDFSHNCFMRRGQWRAHLDQRAAAPLSARQLAAGRSCGAAAPIITFNVRHVAQFSCGAQFGEPGDNMGTLWAGGAVGITTVPFGAAVVPIATTNSLRNKSKQGKTSDFPVSERKWSADYLHLAEGSSPICGSSPWSNRSYPSGSSCGCHTFSWLVQLQRIQADQAPSAGPAPSGSTTGWSPQTCRRSAQPHYICSL